MPATSADLLYDHERPRRSPAPDWGGDDLFDAVPRRRFARTVAEPPAATPAQTPPARRTVTITEHPGRSSAVARPRPRSLTIEQRIHARPDRLAAWAFALGLLLIAIAVATSA